MWNPYLYGFKPKGSNLPYFQTDVMVKLSQIKKKLEKVFN